jgi:hypothetical protein
VWVWFLSKGKPDIGGACTMHAGCVVSECGERICTRCRGQAVQKDDVERNVDEAGQVRRKESEKRLKNVLKSRWAVVSQGQGAQGEHREMRPSLVTFWGPGASHFPDLSRLRRRRLRYTCCVVGTAAKVDKTL